MIVNCEKEKILQIFHYTFLYNDTKVPAPLNEIHGYFFYRPSFTYIIISIFLILIHRNRLTFYDHLSK